MQYPQEYVHLFNIQVWLLCLIVNNRKYNPGGSDGKESACSTEDWDSIPGLGRSPGEGNGDPFQYSCLENLMDRGAG